MQRARCRLHLKLTFGFCRNRRYKQQKTCDKLRTKVSDKVSLFFFFSSKIKKIKSFNVLVLIIIHRINASDDDRNKRKRGEETEPSALQ